MVISINGEIVRSLLKVNAVPIARNGCVGKQLLERQFVPV